MTAALGTYSCMPIMHTRWIFNFAEGDGFPRRAFCSPWMLWFDACFAFTLGPLGAEGGVVDAQSKVTRVKEGGGDVKWDEWQMRVT